MPSNPPKVFVSYSHDSPWHSDRVRALADRLCGDAVDCTIDQYDPPPREPLSRVMEWQIEEADFVLVVCTETYLRRAQGKEEPGTGHGVTYELTLMIQDLYDAAMRNEKLIPVLFDDASSRFIPRPLRGYIHYRVDTDAGYEDLLRHLLNQPRVRKPPIGEPRDLPSIPRERTFRSMVPKPDGFIHRREYDQVVEALCAQNPHGSAVGITTALRGAGGFGKTALAQAVCQDDRVKSKYPDGILLTTMGEEVSESGRLSRLRDLIRWWIESDPPVFERVETASAFLRERLANRRVLLVVDDVWSELDLIPFQGLSSALLVTTREKDILPSGSQRTDVDAMEIPEAVNLLRAGLPEWDIAHFNSLARRLGEWPLLLTLVSRQLRELVEVDGFTVGEALQEVESILESEGLTGFDRENAESRQSAVEKTLAVSLRRLNDSELARYRELAVFPEDVEIPVSVLERFWGNSRGETEKLCKRLDNFSLLLRFDRRRGIIQLHDVVRHYLILRAGEELPNLHRRFLEVLRPLGRLLSFEHPGIRHLLEQSQNWRAPVWLRPRIPTLVAPGGPLLRTIEGHTNWVSAVAVVDGRRAVSASNDRTLRVWDLKTGQILKTLRGHTARVRAVAMADGHRAVSASADQTLRVWDLITGQTLKTLEGHTAAVMSVAVVDGGRAVSASDDGTLRVWDLETGQTLKTLEGHNNWVRGVAVVDIRRAISASADGTLRVWDLESGQTLKSLEGHTSEVRAVAVVDGRRVVSASADGTLRMWDLESGQTLKSLEGHTAGLMSVAVVDSHRVVSASIDGTIRVWDLETSPTPRLRGHTAGVRAVAAVDDHCAVSASADGTIRTWDLATGQTLKSLEGHTAEVRAVAVVDDRCVVSASADGTLRVWDLETGQTLKSLEGHTAGVRAVTMVDGRRAVSASADSTVRVWDLETGRTLKTLEHAHWVRAVAVMDGRRAISVNGTFQMWDLETGQILKTFEGHIAGVRAITVVDGRRAVAASSEKMVRVLDLETGQTLKTLQGHTGWVWAVAALDGRLVVSASDDGTLRVWDLEAGECLAVLTLEAEATAVAMTPDGRTVIAGDSSGWVHFLDLVEAAEDQPPKGGGI